MTSKLIPLALGFSVGVNIILVLEILRLRDVIRDTTRRINYLGRVLNSHAAGNQKVERLP